MPGEILYEDRWGQIIDRPSAGYLEIRWYDATEGMTSEQLNEWLGVFAGHVEARRRAGVLVDSVQFRMPTDRLQRGWRDEHIVPRYNAAGVRRFAFVLPEGAPRAGSEPAREGPAQFLTAYFTRRELATGWLKGDRA